MPTARFDLDPNKILSRPSEWTELSLNQALLHSRFIPVVGIYNTGSTLQAQMLQNVCTDPTIFGPPGTIARYFTQVAPNQSTAAQGAVPTTMTLSDDGADFITGWDQIGGFDRSKNLYFPFDDLDKRNPPPPITTDHKVIGSPTIGYGHLIADGEDYSKGITKDAAKKLFIQDTAPRIKKLNKNLTVRVSQQQFDALLDLAFNAGNSITPPIKQLNAGKAVVEKDFTTHYITARATDKVTHKVTHPVQKGLVKRRKAEWVLFSTGVYDSSH